MTGADASDTPRINQCAAIDEQTVKFDDIHAVDDLDAVAARTTYDDRSNAPVTAAAPGEFTPITITPFRVRASDRRLVDSGRRLSSASAGTIFVSYRRRRCT